MNTIISNVAKQSYIDKSIVNKTKLLIKDRLSNSTLMTLTEENSVKSWEYTCERYVPKHGFIGEFVARTLTGELQNISDDFNIEDKNIELILGNVLDFNTPKEKTEWVSLGTFIINNPTDDEVKDNTRFEAFDIGVLFNKEFDYNFVNSEFTKSFADTIKDGGFFTAEQLAKYVCAQVGVIFGNTSKFINSDFQIKQNPYVEKTLCRDVMKHIAMLAYGYVEIGWDDMCYISSVPHWVNNEQTPIDKFNRITNNEYYTLSTQKNRFGPVNKVTIGLKDIDGESVYVEDSASISKNGVCEIALWDNPLTYTPELRLKVIEQAKTLFGINYIPFECDTIGYPWINSNTLIEIKNMENQPLVTIPFNVKISYNGTISSTAAAPAKTKTEETVGYDKSMYAELKKTKIEVDKADGKINAVAESTKKIETSVSNLAGDVEKNAASFTDFKNNEYVKSIENLQDQIDGAIQFWNGSDIPTLTNYPANNWVSEDDKNNHRADIYTVIDSKTNKQGKSYRFDKIENEWKWIELTDNELSAVQKLAQDALNKANENNSSIDVLNKKASDLEISDTHIMSSVSDVQTKLNNNYTNTNDLNQKLEEQKNDLSLEFNTAITQSAKDIALSVTSKLNKDGVETVKNTLVTIDNNGVNVSKSNESVKSLLSNEGVYVSDGILRDDNSNALMMIDKSGAYIKTLRTVGTIKENECIQKEKTNDEKYGKCQAWYWIG